MEAPLGDWTINQGRIQLMEGIIWHFIFVSPWLWGTWNLFLQDPQEPEQWPLSCSPLGHVSDYKFRCDLMYIGCLESTAFLLPFGAMQSARNPEIVPYSTHYYYWIQGKACCPFSFCLSNARQFPEVHSMMQVCPWGPLCDASLSLCEPLSIAPFEACPCPVTASSPRSHTPS